MAGKDISRKVVLFDFDGTLVDTLEVAVNEYNKIAPWFFCKRVDIGKKEEYFRKYQGKSSIYILKEFGISMWKLPVLLVVLRRMVRKKILGLNLVRGMEDVLESLKKEDICIGILTSNSVENVRAFLDKNDLNKYFDFVRSEKKLFNKHNALNRVIDDYNLDKKNLVYIGDETRDIDAGKKSGIKTVAVSWGYMPDFVLAGKNPDCLAKSPEDVLSFCIKGLC